MATPADRYKPSTKAMRTKRSSTLPPPPPPGPGKSSAAGPPRPMPVPRQPLPTLAEDVRQHSDTLRPAGAVPPPPRSGNPEPLPLQRFDANEDDAATVVMSDAEVAHIEAPIRVEQDTLIDPFDFAPMLDHPVVILEAPEPAADAAPSEVPATPGPPAAEKTSPKASTGPVSAPHAARRPDLAVLGLAVAAGALFVTTTFLLLDRSAGDRGAEPASAPASPTGAASNARASANPAPALAPISKCRVSSEERTLSETIHASVPPILALHDAGDAMALGFARSTREAVGVTLDPTSLAVTPVFEQKVDGPLAGVIPALRSGKLEFLVDIHGTELASARTLATGKPFTLARSADALVTVSGAGPPKTVAPLPESAPITTPRAAEAGDGVVTAFRVGGQSGSVQTLLLTADGDARGAPVVIESDATELGTPAVAARGETVLVALSAKAGSENDWGIMLAQGSTSALPRRALAFDVPSGGPGGPVIAPSVAATEHGWVLQWTEGPAGRRVVRVQALRADLTPVDLPLTTSSPGTDSGQGVIWMRHGTGISLFLSKADSGFSLRGVGLTCR